MKVKVYAPPFSDTSVLDASNMLELPDNSSVHAVYRKLKIPHLYWPVVLCAVNHVIEKRSKVLQDCDVISFIIPVAGG
jgi:molybdopterin converting factor small subunit